MFSLNGNVTTSEEDFIPALQEHLRDIGAEPIDENGISWLISLEEGDPEIKSLIATAKPVYEIIVKARNDFALVETPEAETDAAVDRPEDAAPEAEAAVAEPAPADAPVAEAEVVEPEAPANPIVVAAQSNLAELTLGYFEFDDDGVHFVDEENKPEEGEAVSIIGQMYGLQKSAEHVGNEYLFRIGEICDLCEKEYDEAFYSQAAEIAESDYQLVVIATMLSREYPPSFRKDCPNLSFTHYREVYYVKDLSVEEKQEILRIADRLNMSCATLRKFARGFSKLNEDEDKENLMRHAEGVDAPNAVLDHPTLGATGTGPDKAKFLHIHRGSCTTYVDCDAELLGQPGTVIKLAGPKLVVGLDGNGKVQTEDIALA